jgi:hypothetical protein
MKHAGDEQYLTDAARRALDGEEVLAAGVFGWQDLVAGQIAGAVAGGIASGAVTDSIGVGAIATGLGARAGTEAMAAAHGTTMALLVAVTPDHVRVLNWDGEQPGPVRWSFERATTEVHVSRLGLSKLLRLRDPAAGDDLTLHAAAAPYLAQSKPDKVVLHLLADPS